MARTLHAVLLDMDGTLIDSEKIWSIGIEELARFYGGQVSVQARRAMIGTNMVRSMRILHDDLGQSWRDEQASIVWLETRVKELFAEKITWRPGARELLDELTAAGIRLGLVTATARHLVEVALASIGPDYFGAVISGDDVEHTKPHPMPYVTAAAALGADPCRCVAVEDSPTGIASAVAAGCVVLGVPCEVDISACEGVTIVPSLVDVDVEYLHDVVRARDTRTLTGGGDLFVGDG